MTDIAGVHRGDVVIAEFGDTRGREIRKRRPYVVISPDELNAERLTYLLAPLTTGEHPYRYRVACRVAGRPGHVVLDQIRLRDASLVSRPVEHLSARELRHVLATLREMFAE